MTALKQMKNNNVYLRAPFSLKNKVNLDNAKILNAKKNQSSGSIRRTRDESLVVVE